MTTVTLRALTKIFEPGIPGGENLDLTVAKGELLALLGPSGSGKTTTLRLITGLLKPTRGELLFDGVSMLGTPVERRGAAMMFQEHSLFPFMSVGENVAFGLKLRRLAAVEVRDQVARALGMVQLPGFENRWPDQLSGGQRQRVALARALAIQPRVLLLDEPLSNLEPELRVELREMIRMVQQQAGITTIFVTHDQAEAIAIADRIALMLAGHLRQVGHPRAFFERPADAQVASFFGCQNFIPGMKHGSIVRTALGDLEVIPTSRYDGEVLLTIRPESILVGSNGHNNLQARVLSASYRGQMTICTTQVGNIELEVVTPPYISLQPGEAIGLHIPREHIILLSPMSRADLDQDTPPTENQAAA